MWKVGPVLLALGLSGGTTSVLIATGELLIMTHSSSWAGCIGFSSPGAGVFTGNRKLMREAVQDGDDATTGEELDAPPAARGDAFPSPPRVASIAAGFCPFGRWTGCSLVEWTLVLVASGGGGGGILAPDGGALLE